MMASLILISVLTIFGLTNAQNSQYPQSCYIQNKVVVNWDKSHLSSWKTCYYTGYDHPSYIYNIRSSCPTSLSYLVFVGALENDNTNQYYIGAYGPTQVLSRRTYSTNYAYRPSYYPNGVYWYWYYGWSFGFSPVYYVHLWSADVRTDHDRLRLSWHSDRATGGYRAGDVKGARGNWRKVVKYKYCRNVINSVYVPSTTLRPTTQRPTTMRPTTKHPTTMKPTTHHPTTRRPTPAPTMKPTDDPTPEPTNDPTMKPSRSPTTYGHCKKGCYKRHKHCKKRCKHRFRNKLKRAKCYKQCGHQKKRCMRHCHKPRGWNTSNNS